MPNETHPALRAPLSERGRLPRSGIIYKINKISLVAGEQESDADVSPPQAE